MPAPRIGFLFPGQGAQKLNMAKRLINRYSWASDILNKADRLLARDGLEPISTVIYRDTDSELGSEGSEKWAQLLSRTEYAQPAICLVSLLWLKWLDKIGVKPTALGGHSLGELTAFHAAGAYDAETLIRFSGYRGQIFSDQTKIKGAMISLRCTKQQAEYLLNKTSYYATIANINTPRQVVISGENVAIKQIAKLAAEAAIPAFRLSVTSAFHSKMVAGAAKAIEKEVILPQDLTNLSCRLFSCINGRELTSKQKLRAYFAHQIIAPVDFHSMIQSMSDHCDFFIEVGPGQALSGMANEINNNAGPFCLPVESSPGRDKDLNQLLGTLFTHGIEINWDMVYESRLIRKFVQPSERLFFENPCEKPFNTPVSVEPSIDVPPFKSFETLFEGLEYFYREDRGLPKNPRLFLARIIQGDMDYLPLNNIGTQPPQTTQPEEAVFTDETNENFSEDKSIESILFDTIELVTGFPRGTLTSDMLLLDDLNLDSIKISDLLTLVAQIWKIAGEIPPFDFANLTIGKIAQNLTLAKSQIITPLKPDILKSVIEQIANFIGISSADIGIDAVVEKDLKISKNQLNEIFGFI